MCTMTWFERPHGYDLFFNRDELISRSRAKLPSIQSRDGIQYVSPTDVDAGGTWIAVNQFGITVCLLNHYQFQQMATYKNWLSRGAIVSDFATNNSITESVVKFNNLNLEDYRAFRMFIIDPNGDNALFVWDGHQTRIERNVNTPKSSSSVNAKHVKASRKQYFSNLNLLGSADIEKYLGFHASHYPNKSENSVCMHRSDANTVSLSHISVNQDSASFAYVDGAPCETKFEPVLSIELQT